MQMLPNELAAELRSLRTMRESLKAQLHQFQLTVAATETDKCPDASILYKILKKINRIVTSNGPPDEKQSEPADRKKRTKSVAELVTGFRHNKKHRSSYPPPSSTVLALPPPPPPASSPVPSPPSKSQPPVISLPEIGADKGPQQNSSPKWPTEEINILASMVTSEELTSPQTTVANVIWLGSLQWTELQKGPEDFGVTRKIRRHLPCEVTASGPLDPELVKWFEAGGSNRLSMQLIPKSILLTLGQHCFDGVKSINFHFPESKTSDCLTKLMTAGCAGCVHFIQPNDQNGDGPNSPKLFVLLYSKQVSSFIGFIPHDQIEFRNRFTQAMVQAKLFVMGQKKLQWDSGAE